MQTEEKIKQETPAIKQLDFKSLHFAWFVGQFIVLTNGFIFFLSKALFHPFSFLYRVAYVGIVSSYCIVIYNSYKPFNNNQPFYFRRMLLDENVQYFIIAVYFLFTRRIAFTLLPFVIYSVFHVNDFGKNNIIPCLPASVQTKLPLISIVKNMNTDKLYEQLMPIVSKIEIYIIMTRLVLGLFVLRSSLFSILLYGQFLHMRYYMSPYTREVLTQLGQRIDQLLTPPTAHPNLPPTIIHAYTKVKQVIFRTKGSNPNPTTTTTTTTKKKQ
ncbi:uncharacterized protein BX663DRAFT_512236 [Cokeromyces recurvatus]|uniref:uncharacterized protein n=1 Tax=Cokeromyces recurvatus TaxID=90255 RepID=UPI00221FD630|nr:uncharacterized protein BX663DRAFT_512236 [Cokeromyces recurvatus]KAI7902238.1 hypothetical protein BX663DRAFT_512236 [Cokeromyces recurvatus]